MSIPTPQNPDAAPDRYDEVELLEADETIPPRPEEELADILRAEPDPSGHGASTSPETAAPDA